MVNIKSKKYRDYILRNVGLGICFYCAVGSAQTIDHLPSKKIFFLNLSIEIYNLIPSCSTCNSTKSTYFFIR